VVAYGKKEPEVSKVRKNVLEIGSFFPTLHFYETKTITEF